MIEKVLVIKEVSVEEIENRLNITKEVIANREEYLTMLAVNFIKNHRLKNVPYENLLDYLSKFFNDDDEYEVDAQTTILENIESYIVNNTEYSILVDDEGYGTKYFVNLNETR